MMFRMFFFILACLLVYIPHTSIQDVSVSIENQHHHHQSRRAALTDESTEDSADVPTDLEQLLMTLTEQQYKYETAYYALALNNVFPNFAKLFHERSERKYHDIRGLIRLCQILNLDINLQSIQSAGVDKPLRLLSPDGINTTKFVEFFSDLNSTECDTIFTQLFNVYKLEIDMSVPLQMYLKEKFLMKQVVTCKLTTDVLTQLKRFHAASHNDKSIPFSFMFFDSRVKTMLSQ